MNYRLLGKTGLKVSEVGMGTWQLANDPNCWVGANLDDSLKALHTFAQLGGNFIDTAWIYGYSDDAPTDHPSEQLIAKFIKEHGHRDQLIIATKVPGKNMKWPAWKNTPVSEVFPGDWIKKCVDDSLRSLGIDSIDLMQFHVWQDDFVGDGDWQEAIQQITKSGKVKHWGISVNDYQPTNCFKALDTGLISTVQFIFNIFHQRPTEKLLPYAQKNNIGLIARVPLDEGGLTGNLTPGTKFADGDFRRHYFSPERLVELQTRIESLKSLLDQEATTLPELALRYILSWPAVSTVIPGTRKPQYAKANASVSDGRLLSQALMAKLKSHAWERNFYSDPDPALQSTNFIEP